MLTIASRLDVMNRLGRAMADPTRSRILITLLDGPSYPAVLSRDLDLTRSNVSNHLTCLRDCGIVVAEPEGRKTRYEIADPHLATALNALVNATLAVDENARASTLSARCPAATGKEWTHEFSMWMRTRASHGDRRSRSPMVEGPRVATADLLRRMGLPANGGHVVELPHS